MNLKSRHLRNAFEISILLLILFFAYQLTFFAGERGFFAFDQAIVFDGSYRIMTGQVPYKDFLIPFGPLTFWAQGWIFKLFGLSYASYIFGAAIVNMIVTGVSYYLLRILFARQNVVAYLGGILTAIWFYPPFGTPWPDQTAYFFSILALLGVVLGLLENRISMRWKKALLILSGFISFGAFISKQNAGAFIVPIYLLLFLFTNLRNVFKGIIDFIIFSSGWFMGLASFSLWLYFKSDTALFFKHFLEIPAQEVGADRLPGSFSGWMQAIFLGSGPGIIASLSVLSSLVAIIALVLNRRTFLSRENSHQGLLLAVILAPALFIYQNIFLMTSNNQPENSVPFIGLIAAIGLGVLLPHKKKIDANSSAILKSKIINLSFVIILLIMMVAVMWLGIDVSVSRQVHGIFSQSTFPYHLEAGRLSAIKWAEPTRIGNPITAEDVNQLINYLEAQRENFFVFPDFTILYGALDVPSPQPLLWFHGGLTYPKEYDPTLDAWIVAELERNQVRIIVFEEASWFHTDLRLADFPQLSAFFAENFVLQKRYGNFLIYWEKDQ